MLSTKESKFPPRSSQVLGSTPSRQGRSYGHGSSVQKAAGRARTSETDTRDWGAPTWPTLLTN